MNDKKQPSYYGISIVWKTFKTIITTKINNYVCKTKKLKDYHEKYIEVCTKRKCEKLTVQ